MFEVEKAAETIMDLMKLTGKDIKTVWSSYTHDWIKEGHTLKEIQIYIKNKQKFYKSNIMKR